MLHQAAFFDLDRTVIAGSSGAVVTHRLRDAGVVNAPKLPGEDLLYRVYASMGENLPSMVLARQGVIALRGVARYRLLAAAHQAIDELLASVLPGAREAIDRHRRNGDRVVLATSTPHDLIAAFARRVGFDDVIATRFAVDADDHYTGELDGPFTWSAGKLAAVKEWCEIHDVDLAQSSAYSDSYYDAPLLEAVAHPHAVNPDMRLGALAANRNWPTITFNDLDPSTPTPAQYRDIQRVGLRLLRPEFLSFVQFDVSGTDPIPTDGPAVLRIDYRSPVDLLAIAHLLAQSNRTARFIGPKPPALIEGLLPMIGGIAGDNAESLNEATNALEDGEVVVVIQRPDDQDRHLASTLAAMTLAPLLQVTVIGGEVAWPPGRLAPVFANGPHPVRIVLG